MNKKDQPKAADARLNVQVPAAVAPGFAKYVEWGGGKRHLRHGQLVVAALMALWSMDEVEQLRLIEKAGAYRNWRKKHKVVPSRTWDEVVKARDAIDDEAEALRREIADKKGKSTRRSKAS